MVRSPSIDKNGLKRGAWSEEEDNKLKAYVLRYGHWNWRQLPRFAGLARCGKSCRLRWMNYLKPGLKKGSFSKEEEEMIIKLRQELGNKWSSMATKLPGRTDNEIKNYWNSHLKKRMRQDPKSNGKTKERSQNVHVMDQKEQDSSSISSSESTDREMELDANIAAADVSSEEISCASYNCSNLLDGAENSFSSEESSFPKFFESFWTEPFFPSTSYNQDSSYTSYSSSALDLEDLVTENDISLEDSFVKSFQNLSTEPVSSNALDGLISPSTSCFSPVTNSEESSADAFCSLGGEPVFSNPSTNIISPSTSCNSRVTNSMTEPVFSNALNDLISPSTSCHSTISNSDEPSVDAFGDFWTDPFSFDTSYDQIIQQLPPPEQGVMFPLTSILEYDFVMFNQS